MSSPLHLAIDLSAPSSPATAIHVDYIYLFILLSAPKIQQWRGTSSHPSIYPKLLTEYWHKVAVLRLLRCFCCRAVRGQDEVCLLVCSAP